VAGSSGQVHSEGVSFSYKMKELINQRDAEGRRHGLWEGYYSDGTLRWREHWHHGRPHGLWEGYWPDGTLGWRGNYHHGVKKGLAKVWDSQGGITGKRYHLVIR
jgi:antitoxin component YwqK of YwqJK toxin-antitoxin module